MNSRPDISGQAAQPQGEEVDERGDPQREDRVILPVGRRVGVVHGHGSVPK